MSKLHKSYSLKILVLLIFFSIISCKNSTQDENKPKETEFSKKTKQISSTTFDKITAITDDGTIIFNGKPDEIKKLKPGDVFASEPIDVAKSGFLKKVVSVSEQNGNIIVKTEDASLEDAFKNLSLDETQPLTLDNIESIDYHVHGIMLKPGKTLERWEISADDAVLVDVDGDTSTTYDQITLNGYFELSPSFNLKIKIEDNSVKLIRFTENLNEVTDLTLTIGGKFERSRDDLSKDILTAKFHPITIWVSWFPIVIVPELALRIGADLNVEAKLELHVKQDASLDAGLEYNGDWNPIQDYTFNFTPDQPALTLNGHAYGFVGPELRFLLYGVAGPYGRIEGFLEINADIYQNPAWQIFGGAKLSLGFNVEKISSSLENPEEKVIIDYKKELLRAENVSGTIVGSVKDAVTHNPIEDVKIDIYKDQTIIATGNTDAEGKYRIEVPVGKDYWAKFSKQGYLEETYTGININAIMEFHLEQLLQIDQNYAGNGNFSGQIVNALNGLGVDGLTLKLRKGVNNKNGTVIKTTTTSNGGYYTFNDVAAGNYTVEASGAGYSTIYFSALCIGNTTTDNQNASITPILNESEWRIILTWGENPHDLDSHLTGPDGRGGRFHVFWNNKYYSYGSLDVNLDIDDITSYGPETITIKNITEGLYRYSVHDYSNKESNYSYALSNSDATVRVYKGSNLIKTYYVPANTEGTLWTVFEIQNGTIVTINNMSYESDSNGVRSVGSKHSDAEIIANQNMKK